ncbi:MAG: FecR domain-containing protein [Acidobacteria bacterium]|nr:FecR domain-containing protein [Acidobacteriota bacterium]
MTRRLILFGIASLFLTAFASVSFAQNDAIRSAIGDKYVISAKAGGVNYVEGTVTVLRNDGTSGVLVKGDRVEVGDKVTTGAGGRAEILLNPGSYLRMTGNSGFHFKSTSLDDLRVSIDGGSAIMEVFASDDFVVEVETVSGDFSLVRSGVYRVDIENEKGSLSVIKGRAEVANAENTVVKKGREAIISEDEDVTVAKFDSKDKDELDAWSKARSKELAKMTASLKPKTFRDSLLTSFDMRGWNMYDSFGLWVYNPYTGFYCFLPFGSGWASPYGYWYRYDIWSYRLPPRTYYPPYRPTTPPTGTPNTPGTSGRTRAEAPSKPARPASPTSQRTSSPMARPQRSTPPFARMPSSSSSRSTMDSSPAPMRSAPVYIPAPAPSTSRGDTAKPSRP